jgi:hypothetical protein
VSGGESMKKAAAGLYEDVLVTEALDKNATRDNLRKLIDNVAAEIHPRDTFILFAAAHGPGEEAMLLAGDCDGAFAGRLVRGGRSEHGAAGGLVQPADGSLGVRRFGARAAVAGDQRAGFAGV